MPRYIAIIHPVETGGYSAFFPDVPGCITNGRSFEDLLANAQDALILHLDDDEPASLPLARSLADIQADQSLAEDLQEGIPASILYEPPAGKSERINMTLDQREVKLIDKAAAALGMSRSGFLGHAARAFIAANRQKLAIEG